MSPSRLDHRQPLWPLALGMVLALSTWFSVTAAQAGLRSDLQLDASHERWSIAALQLGFAVGAAGSAWTGLVDRVTPRRLATLGALGAAGANLLPALAAERSMLITSRAATGIALALVYPPLLKAAAATTTSGRGRVMGVMIGALTLGSATPHLVIGAGGAAGWRPVLWITSLGAVAGAAIIWLGVGDRAHPGGSSGLAPHHLRAIARSRPLRLTCIGYLGHIWELYAGWAAMAPFMLAVWHRPRVASLATCAVFVAGAIAVVAAGCAGDRVGHRRAAMRAMAVSGTLVVLLGALVPLPLVATAVAVAWGAAVIADGGQFPALVAEHAAPSLVGSALSAQLASGFALTAIATWLVPWIQTAGGWGWAFACLAAGPAAGAVALRRLDGAARPATRSSLRLAHPT
jgi:MFS family permease